jgi:hypothetical protein
LLLSSPQQAGGYPGAVFYDLKTMTKAGKGHCIISNTEGERIFAEFSCTGDLEGCQCPFTITGGTGKFTGITGEGAMISKIQILAHGFAGQARAPDNLQDRQPVTAMTAAYHTQ